MRPFHVWLSRAVILLSLKSFPFSSAVPEMGAVEDYNTKACDSVVSREALRALEPDSLPLADRCRQLATRHPMLYFSDQIPTSDKKRAHHSHKHRHKSIFHFYFVSFSLSECVCPCSCMRLLLYCSSLERALRDPSVI